MARTRRSRRSYGAGEWGRNRVRVFPDPKTGLFQVEWRENGRRRSRSLGHRDWVRAKKQADEFAAGFASPDLNGKAEAEPEPLTLGTLIEIYGEEVTPTKAEASQRSDRAATRMFLQFFGRGREPSTLSHSDWDRFIRARRAGSIGPSGKPVSDRTVEHDLKFLIAVLNWAARSKDERGRLLLDRNPLKGLRMPMEKNPTRWCCPRRSTKRFSACPKRSIGASTSPSFSRTKRGTGSGPSAIYDGRTSTLKAESSGGGRSTRRRDTSTPRR